MKKKLVTGALLCAFGAVAVTGGTLAYFTDTDAEDNVFTVGNVAIDLVENFDEENAKLIPATGSAQAGTLQNGIKKEVFVKNTGSEPAYVRTHIAIPAVLDNGNPEFNAGKNALHFNYRPESIGKDKWDWSKTAGAPYEGDWNYYEATIDGKAYNVYVVTHEGVLAGKVGDNVVSTVDAMHQVYLDSGVTNEQIAEIKKTLGDNWEIKVVAEGAQEAGFTNAYEALNTAFGVPGEYSPAAGWIVEQ